MDMEVLKSLTEKSDAFTGEEFHEVFDLIEKNGKCIQNANGMWPAVYLIEKDGLFFYGTDGSGGYDFDIFVTAEEKENLMSLGLSESLYHAANHYEKPRIESGQYKLADIKKMLLK